MKKTKPEKTTKTQERSPRFFVKFRRDPHTTREEFVGPKRDDATAHSISAFLTDKEDAEDVAAMWRRFLTAAIVTVEPVRPLEATKREEIPPAERLPDAEQVDNIRTETGTPIARVSWYRLKEGELMTHGSDFTRLHRGPVLVQRTVWEHGEVQDCAFPFDTDLPAPVKTPQAL